MKNYHDTLKNHPNQLKMRRTAWAWWRRIGWFYAL